MIRHVIFLATVSAIAGCAQPDHTPNSANPAHCLAAFNSADYWIQKEPGRHALQLELTGNAMTLYLFDKLRKQGRLGAVRSETRAFIKATGDDAKIMSKLLIECGNALQSEPDFKDNQAHWLRLARRGNARCQQDQSCRAAP